MKNHRIRRAVLTVLLQASAFIGMSAQNDAMFVYRSDGVINAFLRAEVDSVRHSNIDLDSIVHDTNVVQEVWTVDSVYRIPLSVIDSVSFITPPTVYKSDVTDISKQLIDYVIGADSLTLKLMTQTPASILPSVGDKILLLNGNNVLPDGFAGKVTAIDRQSEEIDVICEQTYIEDVFDSYCCVSTLCGYSDGSNMAPARRRVIYNPSDARLHLGPYCIAGSAELNRSIVPNSELALKGGGNLSISIQPNFRIHT